LREAVSLEVGKTEETDEAKGLLSKILENQEEIIRMIQGSRLKGLQVELDLIYQHLRSVQKKQKEMNHTDALNTTKHRQQVIDNFGILNLALGINAHHPHGGTSIGYIANNTEDLFPVLRHLGQKLDNAVESQTAVSVAKHSELLEQLNKLSERCSRIEEVQQNALLKVEPSENDVLGHKYNHRLGKKINTVIAQLKRLEARESKNSSGSEELFNTTPDEIPDAARGTANPGTIPSEDEKEPADPTVKCSKDGGEKSKVPGQEAPTGVCKTQGHLARAEGTATEIQSQAEPESSSNSPVAAPQSLDDVFLVG